MMRKLISEIMSQTLHAAGPDAMVSDVLRIMQEHQVSCVPVLERGKPVGIFTERNLVRSIAGNGGEFDDVPIGQAMTSPVLTARDNIFVYEAFHILDANNIRHLVVVDAKGEALGVVTLSSIVDEVGSDLMIELQPVRSLMSTVVFTVEEDISVRDVLGEMANRSISCVVYTRDNKPLGIVTERDIARMAISRKEMASTTISQVMSSPVRTTHGETSVHAVAKAMREEHVRRLVVVRDDGTIAGLVTQSNIVQGLETRYIRVLKQVIAEKNDRLFQAMRERDEVSIYLESVLNNSLEMGIIGTDSDLTIIYFNSCAEDLLGLAADEVVGTKVDEVHESIGVDSKRLRSALEKVNKAGSYCFQYEIEGEDGPRYRQVRIAGVWDRKQELVGYVHVVQDITDRKRTEDNIRFMAYHDILTGLPNRVAFQERFTLELNRAKRYEQKLAVMLVDLDKFKDVNDTLGHYAGDLLLQEVSRRLQSTVRDSDTVARIGGDEFVLVLPDVESESDALLVAEKISEAMAKDVDVKAASLKVRLSIGVCMYPTHGETSKKLLQTADGAMYEAKKVGRSNGRSNVALARG